MKVSGIDKEFVDIIDILNNNGYEPYASCDGVDASHLERRDNTFAYIAFLSNSKSQKLMAALLRDSIFRIHLDNGYDIAPQELYGNIISGNRLMVYFNNKENQMTDYFKRIINGVINGEINISSEEINQIKKVDKAMKDGLFKKSKFHYEVKYNKHKEEILLGINNKSDSNEKKDLEFLADKIYEKFNTNENPIIYKRNNEFINTDEKNADPQKVARMAVSFNEIKIRLNIKEIEKLADVVKHTKKFERKCPKKNINSNDDYSSDNYYDYWFDFDSIYFGCAREKVNVYDEEMEYYDYYEDDYYEDTILDYHVTEVMEYNEILDKTKSITLTDVLEER